jgi:glyoxylase-like metal-dependent hydrolase (beta-lactamase superfamily II)
MSSYHRLTEHTYLVGSGDFGLSHYCDCNIYLVVSDPDCALIDTGAGIQTSEVIENVHAVIGDLSRLRYILLTHAHADHAGGVYAFKQATAAQVVASRVESDLMEHGTDDETGLAQAMWAGVYPPNYKFTNVSGDIIAEHGDVLRLGEMTITALITPGHTKGSTCYLVTGNGPRLMFSGDEVSWGGLLRLMNLPGSDLVDYREGVKRLANLGVEALFPSHGLWTVRNGQAHIDKLINSFKGHALPPMPARIDRIKPE